MEKTGLKIRLYGDAVLRKKSKNVKHVTEEHRQVLSEMARIMYLHSGIGLAAPQIGINEAMIVVDIGSGLHKLINPKIIKKEGSQCLEEGCLSIPGVCIKVKRARKVIISGCDEFGKVISIEAEDLLACVFQHEIEHLKGRLITDYASFLERIKIKRKLSKLVRSLKDEELSKSKRESCQLQL